MAHTLFDTRSRIESRISPRERETRTCRRKRRHREPNSFGKPAEIASFGSCIWAKWHSSSRLQTRLPRSTTVVDSLGSREGTRSQVWRKKKREKRKKREKKSPSFAFVMLRGAFAPSTRVFLENTFSRYIIFDFVPSHEVPSTKRAIVSSNVVVSVVLSQVSYKYAIPSTLSLQIAINSENSR